MSTDSDCIEVSGIAVRIVRKDIKNLHLGVYPPDGRVRAAVPLRLAEDALRLAVVSRLGWIRRRQRAFLEQARQSEREMVSGETHYVSGRKVRLKVEPSRTGPRVELKNRTLVLRVKPDVEASGRLKILERWYRESLRTQAGELLSEWSERLELEPPGVRIRKMRTRWGSCSHGSHCVWLNLELAKKPPQCVEYIVVHELLHLLERRHNDRFFGLMEQCLPDWRSRRDLLNASPLGHEEWQQDT